MPGQIVHFEIPADDPAKGREFWARSSGGSSSHSPARPSTTWTQISDRTGGAITNMEPGKRGTRAYFDVDDVNAGAARVRELGGEADEPGPCRVWAGS